jgi:hypothetical protein
MIPTLKRCTKCKDLLPLSAFHNSSDTRDGKNYRCRTCRSEAGSEWRREYNLKYSAAHRRQEATRSEIWRKKPHPWRDRVKGQRDRGDHSLTCTLPGCSAPYHARDLCRPHYSQWYRTGALAEIAERPIPPRLCSKPDCGAKHFARDLCRLHYVRYQRSRNKEYCR